MFRVFILVLMVTTLAVSACLADPTASADGVLVESQVPTLPQDSAKWYLSVVGDPADARYRMVLAWFDNGEMKALRNQTHFCPVASNTPIYAERYAKNTAALPMVRIQQPDGTIIYEATGKNLPMSAEGLHAAMASAINGSQGLLPVLPWRRGMEKRCCPQPSPEPGPDVPLAPDPAPQPLEGNGKPEVDGPLGVPAGIVVLVALLCVAASAGVGLAVQWKKTYAQ